MYNRGQSYAEYFIYEVNPTRIEAELWQAVAEDITIEDCLEVALNVKGMGNIIKAIKSRVTLPDFL